MCRSEGTSIHELCDIIDIYKFGSKKTLAEKIFGDENSCIRFDMSEYRQPHSDQRLLGTPFGYVGYEAGGQLTNAVRKNPFSILLFDEIEKAHVTILDKFLQILEYGRMTDGQGNIVYFSESIIIFTSNLGISEINEYGERGIGNVVKSYLIEPLSRYMFYENRDHDCEITIEGYETEINFSNSAESSSLASFIDSSENGSRFLLLSDELFDTGNINDILLTRTIWTMNPKTLKSFCYTPGLAAPEIAVFADELEQGIPEEDCKGSGNSFDSDVYTFAVCLFTQLAGIHPFKRKKYEFLRLKRNERRGNKIAAAFGAWL